MLINVNVKIALFLVGMITLFSCGKDSSRCYSCNPDFGNAYYYSEIEIIPKPKLGASREIKNPKYSDPVPRLSLLKAANIENLKEGGDIGLVSVKKETSLTEATTLMLQHEFSQLPVLSSPRDVLGLISWKSIGTALSLGKQCTKTISGIITATDIGLLFHKLAEPFLIIEQIENLVRSLLDDKLTFDDIRKVLDTVNYDKE